MPFLLFADTVGGRLPHPYFMFMSIQPLFQLSAAFSYKNVCVSLEFNLYGVSSAHID